jgi:zinc and cadmium transporter
LALLGSDALHNVSDGMAIAAGFLVSTQVGFLTAMAVIVHEVPEEVADYALLRASGMPRRRALAGLAIVQLTAVIGAAGTLVASSLIARAEGVMLAIACGTFVYIALVNLAPELRRTRALAS